ncbi:protein PAM71-homolog, chloroplastic-like [Macadamia integrifolia]|uniref:protein PAM71-homolog, chloroplastic-like n=1 Tax=Macadamia integrifolia TaxID=60698 RepID=UPI001C4F41E7|nr:protein PAM71-homolog, chloroplastic-like [Macadamia integrifolia]
MQAQVIHSPIVSRGKLPLLAFIDSIPCSLSLSRRRTSNSLRYKDILRLNSVCGTIRAQASNVRIGSGAYGGKEENDKHDISVGGPPSENLTESEKPPNRLPYPVSIAIVLLGCALAFSLIAFAKGGPSSIMEVFAKSGFTAAFTLIFVSEIGDKTFFIAALLAMQYKKGLVLLGSMGALSLMTILSVVIGRIFHSVPAQFQTSKLGAINVEQYELVDLYENDLHTSKKAC